MISINAEPGAVSCLPCGQIQKEELSHVDLLARAVALYDASGNPQVSGTAAADLDTLKTISEKIGPYLQNIEQSVESESPPGTAQVPVVSIASAFLNPS